MEDSITKDLKPGFSQVEVQTLNLEVPGKSYE